VCSLPNEHPMFNRATGYLRCRANLEAPCDLAAGAGAQMQGSPAHGAAATATRHTQTVPRMRTHGRSTRTHLDQPPAAETGPAAAAPTRAPRHGATAMPAAITTPMMTTRNTATRMPTRTRTTSITEACHCTSVIPAERAIFSTLTAFVPFLYSHSTGLTAKAQH